MKQQRTAFYAVAAIVLAFGIYLTVPKEAAAPAPTVQQQSNSISYKGVENKNALELLKASHQVETQSFSFGEMVQSIDGKKATASEFWAFYVNGAQAQVGADSYQTKPTDTIEWRLEAIE